MREDARNRCKGNCWLNSAHAQEKELICSQTTLKVTGASLRQGCM